jgi:TonB family protein
MSKILDIKNDHAGLIISSILHLILFIFMLFYTFTKLVPELPREGLLVVLGNPDETSLGEEPLGNTDELIANSESPNPPNITQPQTDVKKEEVITSDAGEPLKIPKSTKEKPKLSTKPDAKPVVKNTPTTSTSNSNDKEDLNKKKKKFGSLFGTGQGPKEGNGNSGDPDGSPDAKVLEGISKGRGTIGGGLNGRKVVQAPTVTESSQKYGRVAVKVCVDKNGKVISANATQKGSTTTDAQLVKISEKGAMKYQFAPGDLDSQCGTITFDFKLN